MAKKIGSWVCAKWMAVAPPKVSVPYKPCARSFPQKLQTIVEDTNERDQGRIDHYMMSSATRVGFDFDLSPDFPPRLL